MLFVLSEFLQDFVDQLDEVRPPNPLVAIAQVLYREIELVFPNEINTPTNHANIALATTFFLRCLCPAVAQPILHKLWLDEAGTEG